MYLLVFKLKIYKSRKHVVQYIVLIQIEAWVVTIRSPPPSSPITALAPPEPRPPVVLNPRGVSWEWLPYALPLLGGDIEVWFRGEPGPEDWLLGDPLFFCPVIKTVKSL